jgi:hypothetical protein
LPATPRNGRNRPVFIGVLCGARHRCVGTGRRTATRRCTAHS